MPTTTTLETALGGDAAADSSSLLAVAVGGTVQGTIGVSGDHDFIAVDLVAGQTYTFAMVGIGDNLLTDAALSLQSSDGGTQLANNDDGLQNSNAIFTYTATTSGRYFLDATGFGTATGSYGVSATLGTKADFDAAMIAGAIDTHLSWSATRGSGTTLTFGFSDTFTSGYATFSQFTEAEKAVVRAVLAELTEFTQLGFTEVNPGGYTDEAVLLYGNYAADDGAGAWGGYPGDSGSASTDGNVWVNDASPPTEAIDPGSWFYFMMLHEIGHTMGLSHPGLYNAAPGVTITYPDDAQFLQDSAQYTVMSYFGPEETGASGLYADGFGLYDILALQQIYGINSATRAGDTTYGFGSNVGGIYDFAQNTAPKLTIWDGGGQDTLDASLYSADQLIDLAAGSFSDIGGYVSNVAVAFGAVIEVAIGGRGADMLRGNAADNLLRGGAADDRIYGGAGHDTLAGEGGGDTLYGGAGNDLLRSEDGLLSGPAPEIFDLVTTNYAAGARLHLADTTLFTSASFTLEMVWDQTDLADEDYTVSFGNLSLYRHSDGQVSLLFDGAAQDGWQDRLLPDDLTDGDAHRLSISYDDNSGTLCVYLDGNETARRMLVPSTLGLLAQGAVTLQDNAGFGDIRLFDHARSASDIWDTAWTHLADPVNSFGLVQYWVGDGSGQLISALPSQPGLGTVGPTGTAATALWSQSIGNRMEGGSGDDSYQVWSPLDLVIEATGGGNDSLASHVDFTLGAGQEVEHLSVASGHGGLALGGNDRANRLTSAADAGDTLSGGGGDDWFYVNGPADRVNEVAGGGTDTVYASASFTLGAGSAVEILRANGATGIALTGNELANTLYSGAASDTLAGGAGNDVFYVNGPADRVNEAVNGGTDTLYTSASFGLGAGSAVEILRANGAVGITLTGNELANTLYSAAANDTLAGGAGNDVFYVNGASDRVTEVANGGADTLYASASFALGAGSAVEILRANGATGIALTGNELANTFYSGAASDTLAGGAGNDVFYVNGASDRVTEAVNGGTDTLYASASFTLGSGSAVEILRATGAAGIVLSGNELANTLYSGAANDTLTGGAGNDVFYVNSASDRVTEAVNGGRDTVYAATSFTLGATSAVEILRGQGAVGLRLTGNAGQNQIFGTSGADTLRGGAGRDATSFMAAPIPRWTALSSPPRPTARSEPCATRFTTLSAAAMISTSRGSMPIPG